jgi:HlyD family secretion protein
VDTIRATTPKSRLRAWWVALSAIALLALGIGFWRATLRAERTVERAQIWTERVHRGDLLRQVPVQGTLVPEHVQWLSAAQAARVAQIMVRPGAPVEADTVVLLLENSELELAALEAERQAATASTLLVQVDVRTQVEQKLQESTLLGLRTEWREADLRTSVATRLAPEGLISGIDYKDLQNRAAGLSERVASEESRQQVLRAGRTRQLSAQQAEIVRLQEIARFRRKQLAALEIHAGIHGMIQDIPLEQGQWVAIGTLLAKVAEPGRLKAEVRVAEGNAKDVHKGLGVRFEASSGNIRGHIERVDPAVVAGSVRLTIALDDGPLPSGARADQSVTGFVEIEKLQNTLFVARPAGAQEGAHAQAYVLHSDRNRAARIAVQFGRGSAREIEILSGASDGDELIISDTSTWEAAPSVRIQ